MIKQIGLIVAVASAIAWLGGCEKQSPTTPPANAGQTPPASQGTAAANGQSSHGASVVELGSATIGPFTVRASRDEGAITPGGDAPIDVWLSGSDAKVVAVRFWIGTQSGDESIKARATIEDPAQPNHWHTHADVPNPMPPDSRLWVEIETEGEGKHAGSFDLIG